MNINSKPDFIFFLTEKYDNVTILFSDIVTFTNIAAACTPLDIVNMLNNLYLRFDKRTTEHGVYKVSDVITWTEICPLSDWLKPRLGKKI